MRQMTDCQQPMGSDHVKHTVEDKRLSSCGTNLCCRETVRTGNMQLRVVGRRQDHRHAGGWVPCCPSHVLLRIAVCSSQQLSLEKQSDFDNLGIYRLSLHEEAPTTYGLALSMSTSHA